MDVNKSIIRKKLEHFEASCSEAGLKVTHQRLEIFRELAVAIDHPTAEILYKRLQKVMPTLSLDTVYRTLTTFEKHDLISRVQTIESYARFEAEIVEHHHVICTSCKKITDFQWDILETNQYPEQITQWGQIRGKQITLRGICAACAQKGKSGR